MIASVGYFWQSSVLNKKKTGYIALGFILRDLIELIGPMIYHRISVNFIEILVSQYHQPCWWFAIAPPGQVVIPPKGGLANRSSCSWSPLESGITVI
jgi:hypothetical protein